MRCSKNGFNAYPEIFFRWIEVSELQFRELFANPIKYIFHPDRFAVDCDRIHLLPVANRVEVQVAPLDHVNRVLFQKPNKGVDFPRRVAKSRAIQVVNRDKLIVGQGRIDAFENI